jgi:uncharacterized protein (TIGR03435 family)
MQTLAGGSLVILWSCVAFGQTAAPAPAFEAAEIKPTKSTDHDHAKGRMLPSGQIEVPNATLKDLIMLAYGVGDNMITGGPAWLDSDGFDLVAKAAPKTPMDTLRLMLRPLLEERFKLAFHRVERPVPVYVLLVGKRPLKLQPADPSSQTTCRWIGNGSERVQRECRNMTMANLAIQLPGWGRARIDRPVIDLTELKGAYDFQLQWTLPAGGSDDSSGSSVEPGTTIFEALDQVGLKLEPRKHLMSVICIDHAERVVTGN